MHNKIIDILVFFIIILSVVFLSGCLGLSEIEKYPNSKQIILDKSFLAEKLNMSEKQINKIGNDLNLKLYVINNKTKEEVMNFFEKNHNDWSTEYSKTTETVEINFWRKWGSGHAVIVTSHPEIQDYFGCQLPPTKVGGLSGNRQQKS